MKINIIAIKMLAKMGRTNIVHVPIEDKIGESWGIKNLNNIPTNKSNPDEQINENNNWF